MAIPILAASSGWTWTAWLWLIVPLGIYLLCTAILLAAGKSRDLDSFVGFLFGQISDSLRRATGFPGWAMAGVLTGLLMLGIALMGFYWDVAWHYDFGRDNELFTPSHVMILVALGGLFFAAIITIFFASLERVSTRLHVGSLRVPLPAVLLAFLGFGGVTAFPLDALWHEAYGIDVTLWSPTHLQLMAGGGLATIALWLIIAEVLPDSEPTLLGRFIHALAAGATLTGITIFMGEFEFGGPQFQAVYLPILIAAAASFALVLARIALGPWGAVKAVAIFLGLRVLLGLMVGGALGHTYPRFALYLPIALAVEGAAAWVGTRSRLRFGLVAGALAGTVGLFGEMTWVVVSGWGTPVGSLVVKSTLLGLLAAVAAALLGAGLGRAFTGAVAPVEPKAGSIPGRAGLGDHSGVPVGALVVAGVVLLGVLAYPLPRQVGDVRGVVALERQGDRALVDVTLQPADAADNAVAFEVTAWQGGGTEHAKLEKVGPGHYRTDRAVPITGSWKSTVGLLRGDQVMAAPVYLPADPEIDAVEIPAVDRREVTFVRNTSLLLRELRPGPAWPSLVAYSGLAGLIAIWVGLMAYIATRVRDDGSEQLDSRPETGSSSPPAGRQPEPRLASAGGWYAPRGSG